MKRSRTVLAIVAMMAVSALVLPAFPSQDTPKPLDRPDMSGLRDFDFLVGDWRVHSRKLKEPLSGRFTWSGITCNAAHWEQAYSPDGGKTWETNWVQTLERVR